MVVLGDFVFRIADFIILSRAGLCARHRTNRNQRLLLQDLYQLTVFL
jgi:hypothetical protein